MNQTTHFLEVKHQTVRVQGNYYEVVSAKCANGTMEGERVIMSVDKQEPSTLGAEELAAIYSEILFGHVPTVKEFRAAVKSGQYTTAK